MHPGGQDVGLHHGPGAKTAFGNLQMLRRGRLGFLDDRQIFLGQLQAVIGLGHLEQQLLPGAQDDGAGHFPAQLRLLITQIGFPGLKQGLAHGQTGAEITERLGEI